MAHSRRRFIRDPRTLQHRKGCGTRTGVGNLTRQLMVWYHPPVSRSQRENSLDTKGSATRPVRNYRIGNRFGIASVVLTLAFWGYVNSGLGPNAFTRSPYVVFVLLPGILIVAALLAVVAAVLGSRLWLVALAGPACGALLYLAGRT